uniref:Fibrillar collagen NC1 domain-containing protein n=1 Tax=Eptatretus burgeri TaxID=7764 RepID=A0A8C4WZU6_EPTBU
MCHLQGPVGPRDYYIDPNEGCKTDAIKVWCDMETGASCIHANPSTIEQRNWLLSHNKQKHVWFGEDISPESQVLSYCMYCKQSRYKDWDY